MPSAATEPMLVLHVINGFGPGGAERSLVELLPRYHDAGIESVVAHLKDRDVGYEEEARRLNLPLHRLAGASLRTWIPSLRRLIRELRPSLVHTTLLEADLAGRFASVATGVPVLTSLVNTSYDGARKHDPYLNRRAFRLIRHLDGFTARHMTTHFHAITEAVKESYVSALGLQPDRITVVPRGRNRERLGETSADRRARVRNALGIDEASAVLLNVGRQEYQKGQIHLLQAMPRVFACRPDVILLIAGRPGNETGRLEAEVHASGLHDRVHFLGHRSDVTDLMAAADVFVFPSLFEGLGGSAIEAMALGLPVIASDIPVLREVVGERAGLFARPGDPSDLAEVILRMFSFNGEMKTFGAAGVERFCERFDIDATASRMIDLYSSLATTR